MLRRPGHSCGNSLPSRGVHPPMRRALPEHWFVSVAVSPLAFLLMPVATDASPWLGAVALVAPALLMAIGSIGAPVVASYLLGVLSGAVVLLRMPPAHGVDAIVTGPLLMATAVAVAVTLASQLFFGTGVKRWTAATALGAAVAVGLLSAELLVGPTLQAVTGEAPEMILRVPACNSACEMRPTPSGHLRCSVTTEGPRASAQRVCDGSAGLVHVRSEGRDTSVLLASDEPAWIWREANGKLLVEQAGVPLRALSPAGAVLVTASFGAWSPRQPAHLLRLAGASLLLFASALGLVLWSHRQQRLLARGLAGHVEAGRFYPRDREMVPVDVAGAWRDGPALLFGRLRRASYRDGVDGPARVVSGTQSELAARQAARRLGAWALALGVVVFAMVSVAADLARLQ